MSVDPRVPRQNQRWITHGLFNVREAFVWSEQFFLYYRQTCSKDKQTERFKFCQAVGSAQTLSMPCSDPTRRCQADRILATSHSRGLMRISGSPTCSHTWRHSWYRQACSDLDSHDADSAARATWPDDSIAHSFGHLNQLASLNIKIFGRARLSQLGQLGNEPLARIVSISTSTRTSAADQISEQPPVHCR